MSDLERFREAQNQRGAGFDAALAEMRAGRKRGHWIWYVFPQLAGLGTSAMSSMYGIRDEQEAVDYLRDPELFDRLLTITRVAAGQLGANRVPIETLMGSEIDSLKLVSSLTLFGHVARTLHASGGPDAHATFARLADDVLGAAAEAGYAPCTRTLARLNPRR
jgi:uncharacterized protein (DUF1810 family)